MSLDDVARAAGVTKMTVSNVVNGRTGRVSAVTQERVLAVIDRLGYQPNANARALSRSRSEIVAFVILGTREGQPPLSNPLYATLLGEVEREVAAHGRQLMVHFSIDVATTVATMRSWNVDGAVLLGAFATEVLRLKAAQRVPMVFIDAYSDLDISVCRLDDRLGARMATERLLDAGHTRIAFVGPAFHQPGVVHYRHQGYLEALRDRGTGPDDASPIVCDVDFHEARRLAPSLLEDRRDFTGFVTTADVIAAGLMKGFGDVGVRVPKDVSIVGFDDSQLAEMTSPGLTTVHQDLAAKARGALALLFDQVPGQEPASFVVAPWLVERESVGPPPRARRANRA